MLNGHPISAKLPEDLGFGERFWYWRGLSGQSYIHSIYSRESCPPLPGAVYVVVRNIEGRRKPVCVGRFPALIEGSRPDASTFVQGMADDDEIHVHLLARDMTAAESVCRDLDGALRDPAKETGCTSALNGADQELLVAA